MTPHSKHMLTPESAIPVGKLDQLVDLYPLIVDGITLISKLDKNYQTWNLITTLKYNTPVTLQPIALDTAPVDKPAEELSLPSARLLVVDTLQALEETEHCFLDNTTLIGELATCLHGVDISQTVAPSTREKVTATKHRISGRLQWHINTMPKYVRKTFVWAAYRSNIHAFAHILTILWQLPKNLETASIVESIPKRRLDAYHRPLGSSLHNASLEGNVRAYVDDQKMNDIHSFLAFGKSFDQTHQDIGKRANNPI